MTGPIIGKDEVDIAAMISKLGNSDWVKEGRNFFAVNDNVCPFCQQHTPNSLAKSLEEYFDEAFEQDEPNLVSELDTSLLKQAFDTLEQALETTGRIMQPKGVSRFVATVYASLKEDEEMDTVVLQDCILTVEEALKATRRVMSSKAKTDLILAVYELYSGNALYKEAMTSTINQLIRSVS